MSPRGVLKGKMPIKVQHKDTKAERKEARRAAGRLENHLVSSDTHRRYQEVFQQFCSFTGKTLAELSRDVELLDNWVSEYVEFMWIEGEPKSFANYLVASVQHHIPPSKRHMPRSWRLVATWNKLELPSRATPISPEMLTAMAGVLVEWRWPQVAFLVTVAYSCFLRTGEMFRLRRCHVILPKAPKQPGIIFLEDTKGGQRKQLQWEKVLVYEETAIICLKLLCHGCSQNSLLAPCSMYQFRKLWKDVVNHLQLQHLRIHPYSIRRGGATSAYRRGMSFEELVSRGRWSHIATARIYLDEGLQELASLQLPTATHARLRQYTSIFVSCKPVRDAWKGKANHLKFP